MIIPSQVGVDVLVHGGFRKEFAPPAYVKPKVVLAAGRFIVFVVDNDENDEHGGRHA